MKQINETHQTVCPQCGQSFQCMPENILECSCNTIQLSSALRVKIASVYGTCLCTSCLTRWATGEEPNQPLSL